MKKNKELSGKLFTGLGTALITPFKEGGQIDYEALTTLVNQQGAGGVDFLVPCGTTGESPTLTPKEHIMVIDFVVRAAAGRVQVLAGTGSNNTAEAVHLTKRAVRAGANGVLVVASYYNKPTPAGTKDYYYQVASAADGLPVILYDIPGRCGGTGVSAETILELAEGGAIQGLKWASGNFEQLQKVLAGRPKNFTVLSGDDNLTFPAMCLGADGVISVVSNLIPKRMMAFVHEVELGKMFVGQEMHYGLLPLMQAMFTETNPIPVKTALALTQPVTFKEIFRSPLVPMEDGNRRKLVAALTIAGFVLQPH